MCSKNSYKNRKTKDPGIESDTKRSTSPRIEGNCSLIKTLVIKTISKYLSMSIKTMGMTCNYSPQTCNFIREINKFLVFTLFLFSYTFDRLRQRRF